jgi:hypothetical protein
LDVKIYITNLAIGKYNLPGEIISAYLIVDKYLIKHWLKA